MELSRVLSGKLRLPAPVVEGFIDLLKAEAKIVESRKKPSIPIEDLDDVSILACAIEAVVDVFVTGDKELLDLRRVGDMPIISPGDFWNQLAGLE